MAIARKGRQKMIRKLKEGLIFIEGAVSIERSI